MLPKDVEERINPSIKNIASLEQLLSSYLVAESIIEIREERKVAFKKQSEDSLPKLDSPDSRAQEMYKEFSKLVGYRYPFVYMCKIAMEDMIYYDFVKDPSVVTAASQDTAHFNKEYGFGTNYTILAKVNLYDHTLNVFEEGLIQGREKGRAMQIAIPMLACLLHDFGKSNKIRSQLQGGDSIGKVYTAHAQMSGSYIKEILLPKYNKMLNEIPMETINSLARAVESHHPNNAALKKDIIISEVIKADTNARKKEFQKISKNLKGEE